MNTWITFLSQQGASISDTTSLEVQGFNTKRNNHDFVAPLTDLGLITLSGEEAASFLHNQITNDVEHLAINEARLAGYCTPKGRLLATLLMWKSNDTIYLQLPREILTAIQKRLQMFVLRAKVKLADASDSYVALGLVGHATGAALLPWFSTLPALIYGKVDSDNGTIIRLPDVFGAPRYQWICPTNIAQMAWPTITQLISPAGTHAWRLTDIQAGVPRITQATQDQFVPQMINYELIGGVNFKKGCYPGQEIVARSQYLGKLKRRMVIASIETESTTQHVKASDEIFSSTDPNQPCGMIVNVERVSDNDMLCLAEIKVEAIQAGTVHLGSLQGPLLHFKEMPYPFTVPG